MPRSSSDNAPHAPLWQHVYLPPLTSNAADRALGVEWCVAGPSALIGASNFVELAVATAIVLFGFAIA